MAEGARLESVYTATYLGFDKLRQQFGPPHADMDVGGRAMQEQLPRRPAGV